jgi:heme exporter protein C
MKTKSDIGFFALSALTALGMLYLFYLVFMVVPTAQLEAGGTAQRIFYIHLPAAYGLYLSGLVCFVGSTGFLLKPTDRWNAIAQSGAECAVLFGLVMLTTGPLWAKKAWGVYWVWDPRLTTTLLTEMIYLAVVVLRSFAGDGHAERKFAAALGVLGTVNLPIIHYAVRKWGGEHPSVVTGSGGGLGHPDMYTTLNAGFFAVTLLAALLLWSRAGHAVVRARVRRAEELALERGLLDN